MGEGMPRNKTVQEGAGEMTEEERDFIERLSTHLSERSGSFLSRSLFGAIATENPSIPDGEMVAYIQNRFMELTDVDRGLVINTFNELVNTNGAQTVNISGATDIIVGILFPRKR